MRILILNPDYGMTEEELSERIGILKEYVSKDTELVMRCLTESVVYLDSVADAVLAGPEILRMAQQGQREGFDAVVLYCFSDPAIEACREILDIPVIGGGQSACLSALQIARQFGVIVSREERIPEKRLFVGNCGIGGGRAVGFRAVDLAGKSAREDVSYTLDKLTETGHALIEEDGAQSLILGCLSFLGMAKELSGRLLVPVIDPAVVSVLTAEAFVRAGLATSKKSYPVPPKGSRFLREGSLIL